MVTNFAYRGQLLNSVYLVAPVFCLLAGSACSSDSLSGQDPFSSPARLTTTEGGPWAGVRDAASEQRARGLLVEENAADELPSITFKANSLRHERLAEEGLAPTASRSTRTIDLSDAIPAAVDNSQLPSFPPIRSQGNIGSCVAFAVGYYAMTHELGLARGWGAEGSLLPSQIVSPAWVYNLGNGGVDGGMLASDAISILQHHGSVMWEDLPYVNDDSDPVNYRAWPTSGSVWRRALSYQLEGTAGRAGVPDEEYLSWLKAGLANGHVAVFGTTIGAWRFASVTDDPNTTLDDAHVGEQIVTWNDGVSTSFHAMTVVGYNDNLWVDINLDGVVDPAEKGALKIANSWGENWMNGGFVWVSYDAVFEESRLPDGPTSSTRDTIFDRTRPAFLQVDEDEEPSLLLRATVTAPERNDVRLSLNKTALPDTEPYTDWYMGRIVALNTNGGAFAFDGTEDPDIGPVTFYFDATRYGLSDHDTRYTLGLYNGSTTAPADLADFALIDTTTGEEIPAAVDSMTVPARGYETLSIDYRLHDPELMPELTVTPNPIDMGAVVPGETASVELQLRNTGKGIALLRDVIVAHPDFSVSPILGSYPIAIRHDEYQAERFRARFTPSDLGPQETVFQFELTAAPSVVVPVSGMGNGVDISAEPQIISSWENGFCSEVLVTNHGPLDATGWNVVLTLPNSEVQHLWNAVYESVSERQISVSPTSHSPVLQPDDSIVFGFCTSYDEPDGEPTVQVTSVSGYFEE